MSDSSTANRWIVVSCPSCGSLRFPSVLRAHPPDKVFHFPPPGSPGEATPSQDWPRDSRLPRFCLWIMAHRYPGPWWLYQADAMYVYIHAYIRAYTRCFINICQQICIPSTFQICLLVSKIHNRYWLIIYFCKGGKTYSIFYWYKLFKYNNL